MEIKITLKKKKINQSSCTGCWFIEHHIGCTKYKAECGNNEIFIEEYEK